MMMKVYNLSLFLSFFLLPPFTHLYQHPFLKSNFLSFRFGRGRQTTNRACERKERHERLSKNEGGSDGGVGAQSDWKRCNDRETQSTRRVHLSPLLLPSLSSYLHCLSSFNSHIYEGTRKRRMIVQR